MTAFRISKDGEIQEVEFDGAGVELVAADGPYEGWTIEHEVAGALGPYDMIVDGQIVLNVEALDAELHAQIDAGCGAFRKLFITDIAGQEMAYKDKLEEALIFLAGVGDPEDWEGITLEAAEVGMTEQEVAVEVQATALLWRQVGRKIEARRIGAKRAVTAAVTREAKVAAAEVDWMALLAPPGGGGG